MKKSFNFKALFLNAILILTLAAAAKTAAAAPGNDNLANATSLQYDSLTEHTLVDQTNSGATREAGEKIHYNQSHPGEKTVWYKWAATLDASVKFEMNSPQFASLITVYKAAVANPTHQQLTKVVDNLSAFNFYPEKNVVRFRAFSGTHYFIVVGSSLLNQPTTEGLFSVSLGFNKLRYSSNFGVHIGDKTSFGVYRPSEGVWYVMRTLDAINPDYYYFGMSGAASPDQPLQADFDGDSLTDLAVTRNVGGYKYWWIKDRFNYNFDGATQWGLATDKTLTGDFDRDGRADLVAIRNNGQNLVWWIWRSKQNDYRVHTFGLPGDTPVVGDFDGDGATDIAVTRLTNGELYWHILKSGYTSQAVDTYIDYMVVQHGAGSDQPVVEDFDGDGKSDLAVFRHVNGNWLIKFASNGDVQEKHFGQFLDKPQPGDFDGDGKADLVVYRPSLGDWYFWLSGTDQQTAYHWGIATDVPVASTNSLWQ